MSTYRRRRETPPPAPLPSQRPGAAPRGIWLVRGDAVRQPGVIWIKRPMPPDQWPVNIREPRDNSFRWWIRAHCGHRAMQFAFYKEADADGYEYIFRDDPCWWTRCGADRTGR
jgi:hypothetical protein